MLRKGTKAVAKSDLDSMTLKQMLDMQEKLAVAIESKRKEERDDVKRALADMAEKRGFSMDDLFGSKRGKGKPVAVKYVNPDNKAETWTGRGRKPNWLVSALKKSGTKIEQFAI
jgi:DNA-binding protein H-NS